MSDYVFDTVIDETAVNQEMDDIATALTASIAADGQTTISANLPMNSKKLTGLAVGTANGDSLTLGQAQNAGFSHATSSGTNTVALTLAPAITAYAAGQHFTFKAGGTNTGATTLNVNTVGAKAIQKLGAALAANDITTNDVVTVVYDGTQFQMTSPARALGATLAVASGGTGSTTAGGARTNLGASAGSGSAIEQGLHTIWVPAAAMRPTVSNGCAPLLAIETTAGRPDMDVLDFDASADEAAQFQIAFPKSWNLGTVTFQAWWTSTATDTDGVAIGLQGLAVQDNETIDQVYGTAVVVTDDAQSAAEEVYVTAASAAVTIAAASAIADDNICFFRVFRDISDANDDMAEDMRLLGIKLFYTTDAATDV